MTDSELIGLLRDAYSDDESIRKEARNALRNLELHDARRADTQLEQWSIRHQNDTGTGFVLWMALFATMATLLSGMTLVQRTTLFGIAVLIGCALFLVYRGRQSSLADYEGDPLRVELGKDVPATAARLIDRLIMGPSRFTAQSAAFARLTSILPTLGPDDLSAPQRQWLVGFLDIGNVYVSEELLAEILQFLGRTKDVEAYGRIKAFATYSAVSARALRLQAKARTCLATLEPLIEQARVSGSLLRPSDAPAESLLLRPAGDASTQEKVLLRPVDRGDAR